MVGELHCLKGYLVSFEGVPLLLCTYGFLFEVIYFLTEFGENSMLTFFPTL